MSTKSNKPPPSVKVVIGSHWNKSVLASSAKLKPGSRFTVRPNGWPAGMPEATMSMTTGGGDDGQVRRQTGYTAHCVGHDHRILASLRGLHGRQPEARTAVKHIHDKPSFDI